MVHHRHHESAVPGVIPVPHGPADSDSEQISNEPIAYATADERRIFSHVTRPDDSYNEDGVYWADLPLSQRYRFVSKVDNDAAKEEAATAWSMFKEDPLSPLSWYFRHAVIPGAGLGLEGYVLFSIGNLEPLFKAVWPDCWGKDPTTCSHNWIAAVTYLEIIGIMVGQAVVGVMGDWVGRRWGLIQDAAIMFIGLLMLTASWGLTLQGWVICYAWSLFFYGFGVGGEYPITATSSLEGVSSGGRISTREDRLHRGRRVTTAFLMQGWGQFVNQVILIALLAIFNNGKSSPPYSASAAQYTFRLSFAFPAIGTLWLLYYRTYRMRSAGKQLAEAKKRSNVTGYDLNALRHCFSNFGGRLLATSGTWFCNDVFFYGNKLFQGQFIKVISPGSNSIFTTWTWNLVNITVSLAGYYLASLLIDNKMYGRKMMQQVGFFMCFLMFVIPAFKYDYYTSPAGIHSFQAMYFISSFFNQFGPNSVTFLVAGEVFPTPVRATAHGFSACIGKSGALLASVLYNYIDDQTKFYVVPWFGLAGMLLTYVFLPDTTGLDLKEQERRWHYIRDGKESEYHGVAVNPIHLSLWERLRGIGKNYDPEADWRAKVQDMRTEWELVQANRGPKETEGAMPEDGEFSPEIHEFFKRSSPKHIGRRDESLMVDSVNEKTAAPSDDSITK
ncbi:mfs transporter [Fusarium langsethiae]|uniref:Mfs transporter n=2 Tax=Fusarium sambucinum species complex TaxID=569360 RepID=A0A0N0V8G0_FUSLA|nr:mfs transporter [Fusarium langsethiae]RGP76600.1 hypothetical protein FSPOR_31 [Fusarium sporotrichioides]GKT99261.1 unnamed protein product [Fusarium langsethiae]GKU13724.1 unnamed protein product [Fusarium langsethiae]